jgi:Raf kinase inhibitor-like YbhB/YbcL family protein
MIQKSIVVIGFLGGAMAQGLTITSESFKHNHRLPNDYVYTQCGGKNRSPQLSWHNAPVGTQSFAIICDDPDAPTDKPFVHWIIVNIPSAVVELSTGLSKQSRIFNGALQGKNDFGNIGYDGPCPPQGHGVHRYFFRVYALDTVLESTAGETKEQFDRASKGHILATAEIIGLYEQL